MSKRRKNKDPKVVYRRLGREAAWGQATLDPDAPLIEIDPRLGAKRMLEVTLHEGLHVCFPQMTESEVDKAGKQLSRLLWSQDYRRVLLQANDKPPRIS